MLERLMSIELCSNMLRKVGVDLHVEMHGHMMREQFGKLAQRVHGTLQH
ncbi:hypothetical protein [Embleya scabrispora]|nr:hypothetical protein [Embleya scabrispora]MYS87436.1 hypothetical protein [Streptomyces sp. SID5474]